MIGIANGALSILKFAAKEPRKYGCGIYLFTIPIVCLLTLITFALKYILLISIQMNIINGRSSLMVQCFTVDFLLKILLKIGDWLYASVAVERFFIVVRGINFNDKLSQKAARWVIIMLVIFSVSICQFMKLFTLIG